MENKLSLIMLSLGGLALVVGLVGGCGQNAAPRIVNPPNNLAVARVSGSLSLLTWEASADSNIAGYCVYRGATAETASLLKVGERQPATQTYTDSGLSSTEGYYYAVTAIAASRESAYTDRIYAPPYTAYLPVTISGVKK